MYKKDDIWIANGVAILGLLEFARHFLALNTSQDVLYT